MDQENVEFLATFLDQESGKDNKNDLRGKHFLAE